MLTFPNVFIQFLHFTIVLQNFFPEKISHIGPIYIVYLNCNFTLFCSRVKVGWVWDLCVGWLNEHRCAVLIIPTESGWWLDLICFNIEWNERTRLLSRSNSSTGDEGEGDGGGQQGEDGWGGQPPRLQRPAHGYVEKASEIVCREGVYSVFESWWWLEWGGLGSGGQGRPAWRLGWLIKTSRWGGGGQGGESFLWSDQVTRIYCYCC